MSSEFNKVLESFKHDFALIKGKEVPSNRRHNTGIGKTFEDIIGVEENNNLLVDYKGQIELKSQRDYTGSMLTLFTKSPDYPTNAMRYLSDNFGSPDLTYPHINILHTTVQHSRFNSYKGNYGFKLELNVEKQKLYLRVKDLINDRIVNNEIYWELSTLEDIVNTKCKNIAYVTARSRTENGQEYFTFVEAVLLSGMTFDKFIDLIKRNIIVFDIRIGVYREGKKAGQRHDHGPAFRIPKNYLPEAFTIEKI